MSYAHLHVEIARPYASLLITSRLVCTEDNLLIDERVLTMFLVRQVETSGKPNMRVTHHRVLGVVSQPRGKFGPTHFVHHGPRLQTDRDNDG